MYSNARWLGSARSTCDCGDPSTRSTNVPSASASTRDTPDPTRRSPPPSSQNPPSDPPPPPRPPPPLHPPILPTPHVASPTLPPPPRRRAEPGARTLPARPRGRVPGLRLPASASRSSRVTLRSHQSLSQRANGRWLLKVVTGLRNHSMHTIPALPRTASFTPPGAARVSALPACGARGDFEKPPVILGARKQTVASQSQEGVWTVLEVGGECKESRDARAGTLPRACVSCAPPRPATSKRLRMRRSPGDFEKPSVTFPA